MVDGIVVVKKMGSFMKENYDKGVGNKRGIREEGRKHQEKTRMRGENIKRRT